MEQAYTHHLVTRGLDQFSYPLGGLTPILLCPIGLDQDTLARLAYAEVCRRAERMLPPDASWVDKLNTLASSFITLTTINLWSRDIRLVRPTDGWDCETEVAITWRMYQSGMFPPSWQGPANGVIPHDKPVTVFSREVAPTKLTVLEL